jgi:hypothetical protein
MVDGRFSETRYNNCEMPEGMEPESSLQDKSRDSRKFKLPMSFGIPPERRFLDRFRNRRPSRFVSSGGMSLERWLLDKSIPVISAMLPSKIWYCLFHFT